MALEFASDALRNDRERDVVFAATDSVNYTGMCSGYAMLQFASEELRNDRAPRPGSFEWIVLESRFLRGAALIDIVTMVRRKRRIA